jgi:hippurate hydrolase
VLLRAPPTANDEPTTARVAAAFTGFFADRAQHLPRLFASEDFSDIPTALGVPYTLLGYRRPGRSTLTKGTGRPKFRGPMLAAFRQRRRSIDDEEQLQL